jgi:hypothetical protein
MTISSINQTLKLLLAARSGEGLQKPHIGEMKRGSRAFPKKINYVFLEA